ncbi:MAG: thiaminase II, partial [Gammaproteobacteria bacterium]|nr:thiaminase II [Gammaproteobacteria bacterium]NIR93648.1 thiaminase II [Gammaproteobacteria bacterium]NIW45822.1 thiaminase II [Gammaproteobacteria bacterium]NIX57138.1 thiaminase II [candidate division Zixibacteria bacterium]
LIATSYQQPYEVSVAALLPCFWIYRDVGHHIYQRAEKENPYERWIATYSGDEFGEAVSQAIDITDQAAAEVDDKTREVMTEHFIKSSRLEWMFWHSAYRQEQWRP